MAAQKEGIPLFAKILILVGVALIVITVIVGTKFNLWDIFWTLLKIVVGVAIIALVIKGILSFFKPKPYSPTEDFKQKLIRGAKMRKPFNVKTLFLRGEDMMVYSKWFNIEGLLFIPYLSAKTKTDKKGKPIFVPKMDVDNKPMIDPVTKKPILVPDKEMLTEMDGDWVFVGSTGFLFNKKTEIVRAHKSLVSEIGESVFIKTVNLVPVGEYWYPVQQWQDDITRVLAQHKAEAVVMTHENFLDLIATTTQMALGGDPTYQKILQQQSEVIAQRNAPALMRPVE